MNKPSSQRRPSSGPNTSLKRRRSNRGDDGFDTTDITGFPRQKPGISSQGFSYGIGCATTYAKGITQQPFENYIESENLISKTTLDTLRRFRYLGAQTPKAEEIRPGLLNGYHGYHSATGKYSGHGPSYDSAYNTSLPSVTQFGRNQGAPNPYLNTTEDALRTRDGIGMAVQTVSKTGLHKPVHGFSTPAGTVDISSFSSPDILEYCPEIPTASLGQSSSCSESIRRNDLSNMPDHSHATDPECCNSPNSFISSIQGLPQEGLEFHDNELDEAGLVALADAYNTTNSTPSIPKAATTADNKVISQNYLASSAFVDEPTGPVHSYESYVRDTDDEYAVDPEYFNCAAKAFVSDKPSKKINSHDVVHQYYAKDLEDDSASHDAGAPNVEPYQGFPSLITTADDFAPPSSISPPIDRNRLRDDLVDASHVETYPSSPNLHRPFLRQAFPPPVRDRSNIQGLSSQTVLRTCFRIGEALKGFPPSPTPTKKITTPRTTVIELYAFVSASYVSDNTHFFTFADLFFPTRPPYLKGKWAGGDPNNNIPCRQNYKKTKEDIGSMCRVIGTIGPVCGDSSDKNPSSDNLIAPAMKGMVMRVLGIWRADWNHVEYVKGIVEA